MSKTNLENDTICHKNIAFDNNKMSNHMFEHLYIYTNVIFLYFVNKLILPHAYFSIIC